MSRNNKKVKRCNAINRRAYQVQSNNKYYGIIDWEPTKYGMKRKQIADITGIDGSCGMVMSNRVLRRHKSIQKKQEVNK